MCGITGFVNHAGTYSQNELVNTVTLMADRLSHRGPDDSGNWVDESSGIAFGFRRLAIIDLSGTGHQPMLSHSGRYVIIFNGEIYNFKDLRIELEKSGSTFNGSSDTEVILEIIERKGIKKAVQSLNGMFAIALWDRQEKTLSLIRDRIGIKPLYYGWNNGIFLFGSELKAIKAHPAFSPSIDRNTISLYLRHNYIPAPFSIYEGIYKLLPGSILTIRTTDNNRESIDHYWSAKDMVETGIANQYAGTMEEAANELEYLLKQSIEQRMISDVSLGAFLSGGVDSSTIVSIMQSLSSRPIKTFTIGFWEREYDEARYARQIAAHLHTDHTELYVTPKDAIDVIPRLPNLYDEPFADSSQIPTFLISQLARKDVTVSLSGDGGDELFGGYNRYLWAKNVFKINQLSPKFFKKFISGQSRRYQNGNRQDSGLNSIANFLHVPLFQDKLGKILDILQANTLDEVYFWLVSQWKDPESILLRSKEPKTLLTEKANWPALDGVPLMMYLDLMTYLPDDILVKVDRASMGVSLESRVPFLDDHRIIEFAWKIPLDLKIKRGKSKMVLREVLFRYVPSSLIERPKRGFAMPIDKWLRTDLRDWAENLLNDSRLDRDGFFVKEEIKQKWQEHTTGQRNWQYLIWPILMFQAWLDFNKS